MLQGSTQIRNRQILERILIGPAEALGAAMSAEVDRPHLETLAGKVILHRKATWMVAEDEAVHPIPRNQGEGVSVPVDLFGKTALLDLKLPPLTIVHIVQSVFGEGHGFPP